MIAIASSMVALLLASPASAAPVENEKSACALVKTLVSLSRHFPLSTIAFCDMATSRRGYFVLALHGKRDCDGICSTNMGWFAVQKVTGRVFEWNVAEDKLGRSIGRQP